MLDFSQNVYDKLCEYETLCTSAHAAVPHISNINWNLFQIRAAGLLGLVRGLIGNDMPTPQPSQIIDI
jgi:hypothetical protein